jgi:succinylarginine dihydrolase
MPEAQLDGLVGPTHNYGGLSPGNVASTTHGGQVSNPRAAALEGLAKMRFVSGLGVLQGVLPPHDRPSLHTLRALGFHGSDEAVIAAAGSHEGGLFLRLASSASSMWTANAATVIPSRDAGDGKLHFVPANLQQMFHRAIEAATTTRILRAIFRDEGSFVVHDPLPGGGQLADEGAANHTRLATDKGALHLFAWGRHGWGGGRAPSRFPARQTREASLAIARLGQLPSSSCRFPQQHPDGIDAGAFHSDVLMVGNESFLMLHELAFEGQEALVRDLQATLGEGLTVLVATSAELPAKHAVLAYPFNSQVVSLPDGTMVVVAPEDAQEDEPSRRFLERVVASPGPVKAVHYRNVRQSMHNGGGPACLRLRVLLTPQEASKLGASVLLDEPMLARLEEWVTAHYRDRLTPDDLADPSLARETMTALDVLTRILGLGSVYDFQSAR